LAILVLQETANPSDVVLDVSEQSDDSGDVAVFDVRRGMPTVSPSEQLATLPARFDFRAKHRDD